MRAWGVGVRRVALVGGASVRWLTGGVNVSRGDGMGDSGAQGGRGKAGEREEIRVSISNGWIQLLKCFVEAEI